MSYTIEYDRVFLVSDRGITPLILTAENNVWCGYRQHDSRPRSWSVFYNTLGTTEEALMKAIEPSLGGYGEHWMRNGKWVDDEALKCWVKNGCKKAVALEDLLRVNSMTYVEAYVAVWEKLDRHEECKAKLCTTKDLDEWIDRVKDVKGYPILAFPERKLNKPDTRAVVPDEVFIKHKNSYLVEVSDRGSSWSTDIRKAKAFPYDKAKAMVEKEKGWGWIGCSKLVAAKVKPYNAMIRVTDGPNAGRYVQKRTRGKVNLTSRTEYAKCYPDKAAAEAAVKRMDGKFSCSFEVVLA